MDLLEKLKRNAAENAWAIQDLTVWPDRSRFHHRESAKGLSYLHVSGHPAQAPEGTVILDDTGGELEALLEHLPKGPFIIRETNANVLPKVKPLLPNATIYLEQRMEASKESFRSVGRARSRAVTVDDAGAMAEFYGAPPPAAEGFKNWIRGALIMGVFESGRLLSLGTTIVRTPGAWVLAEIKTRPEERGKGYASDVVSALTAAALASAPRVSLTVMKDNDPAIRVYSKLGYVAKEDRVWISNGVDARPS